MSLTGYLINENLDNFYYVSVSRLHSQTLKATNSAPKCVPDGQEEVDKAPEQVGQSGEPEDSTRVLSGHPSAAKSLDKQAEMEKMELNTVVSFICFCLVCKAEGDVWLSGYFRLQCRRFRC